MGLGDATHTSESALSVSRPGFIRSGLEGSRIGQNSRKQKVQADPSHLQMGEGSMTQIIQNNR